MILVGTEHDSKESWNNLTNILENLDSINAISVEADLEYYKHYNKINKEKPWKAFEIFEAIKYAKKMKIPLYCVNPFSKTRTSIFRKTKKLYFNKPSKNKLDHLIFKPFCLFEEIIFQARIYKTKQILKQITNKHEKTAHIGGYYNIKRINF
ncbi:MAG: hypothetical protein GON13_00765 [Nanoarchaeota archaeon]|nr:hypothetical protein [Nanoarchaeota archaeon]